MGVFELQALSPLQWAAATLSAQFFQFLAAAFLLDSMWFSLHKHSLAVGQGFGCSLCVDSGVHLFCSSLPFEFPP